MTPKEKANELLDKHRTYIRIADKYGYLISADEIHISIQCTLITIEQLIQCTHSDGRGNSMFDKEYWQAVKKEIEKKA